MSHKERLELLAAHRLEDKRADFLEDGPLWCGLPQWKCSLCPFSTTQEIPKALYHVGEAHKEHFPEPRKTVTVESKLVSPTGGTLFLEV